MTGELVFPRVGYLTIGEKHRAMIFLTPSGLQLTVPQEALDDGSAFILQPPSNELIQHYFPTSQQSMSKIFMKSGAWFCGSIKDAYWTLHKDDATKFPTQEAIDIISELRKDKGIVEIELVISNEKK